MDITKLIVPRGLRYISQWEDFELPNYPNIIDKQIPGCGFTEYCLTNNQNIILVSPRKILLENKNDQHLGEVYLVKSILKELGVDLDLNDKRVRRTESEIRADKEAIERNFRRIKEELTGYYLVRSANNLPTKVLVTYDSFGRVKEILSGLGVFDQFYVVVDEFQSLFVDSRFKSDTELEFLNHLGDVQNLCYVSATPMIKEYLEILDEFKDLPYFQLDWETDDPGRVVKPRLEVRSIKSVQYDADRIISSYRSGNFKISARRNADGSTELVQSREAVIYVNSVNNIVNIINKSGLSPNEVNILCADTPENTQKLQKKLGREYSIGRVPTKDEPRKMFTLCTRTVYLGADFYSDNARTFIFSDANIDSMAVDITLDLPQILGRQRLSSNPWKNKAMIYVRFRSKDLTPLKEFREKIEGKLRMTEEIMENYEASPNKKTAIRMIEDRALDRKYRDDYVAVNKHGGSNVYPVLNKLVMISEQRAYDVQQVDYADRFTVFNQIEETFTVNSSIDKEVVEFQEKFNRLGTQKEQLRFLCTEQVSEAARPSILDLVPEYMKRAYIMLGPERCRALGYDHAKLKRECSVVSFDRDLLKEKIYGIFQEGDIVLKSALKEFLSEIYSSIEYKKTPKASDINNWFETRRATKYIGGGKYKEGFELLRKLY